MLELTEKEEDFAVPSDKPLFEAREPGPVTASAEHPNAKKYMGQERRRDNRRQSKDRRDYVRFELDKSDRRENPGRREDDAAATFW